MESKVIRFYLIESLGSTFVVEDTDLERVAKVADSTPEEFEAAMQGTWHTMTLKPALGGMRLAMQQRMSVVDELGNRRNDPNLGPLARIETVIESWDMPYPLSKAGLDAMPLTVADFVDAVLTRHLFPNLASTPLFSKLLLNKESA